MQQGKVLFMDLDDTLLSDDKSVSPKNLAAIRTALLHGNSFVVTTGRPVKSSTKVIKELGLYSPGCYLIAFNGSVICDCAAERIFQQKTIPIPYVKRLFDEAKKAGIYVPTYDKADVLAECYTKELAYYTKRAQMTYRLLSDTANALTEEPYKVLLICLESRAILEKFQKENFIWSEDKMNSFLSGSAYLEYCPLGVDKGTAILEFCKLFGISPEQTIAVGDEWNDISMIKAAHVGIAVENAVDAVKEAADYVTVRDHNHDAVAEVIEKFM